MIKWSRGRFRALCLDLVFQQIPAKGTGLSLVFAPGVLREWQRALSNKSYGKGFFNLVILVFIGFAWQFPKTEKGGGISSVGEGYGDLLINTRSIGIRKGTILYLNEKEVY